MLPFTTGLVRVGKFDLESALLADKHYSRQTVGSNQFMPPGKTMVLRNTEGTIVFGWLSQEIRDDCQEGYNCSIFRNESLRRSSEIILEAEAKVNQQWGPARMFTYVDPAALRRPGHKYRKPKIPGRCFFAAGWKLRVHKNGAPHTSSNGLWLFVKPPKRNVQP
jgi:hypothetical protein